MEKYVYIFEDWSVRVGSAPSEEDLQAADDGYLSIINPRELTEYFHGEWIKMEEIK